MKTNLLTFAATILLAASANTAFADIEYYLVGDATSWNLNSDYKFESTESGIYTLTKTLRGEFKLQQKNGEAVTWVGANSNGVYQATANYPTANLVFNGGTNLNLQFEAEYTFTINTNNQYTLNIGGLDGFLVAGSFNGWSSPKSMTKQSDGSYIFPLGYDMFDEEGKLQFKIVDFNNQYYGGSSNDPTHQIKHDWHTNISLVGEGGKNFEITDGEWLTMKENNILVKDRKVSVLGYTVYFDETLSYGSPSSYQNQVYDVQLEGRKFYCDGYWNTVCLPFNVDNFSSTIFNDADVMTLESSEFNAGTLTLNFNTANSISAGVPYIVRWSNGGNDINGPYFYDVTINSTVGQAGAGPATFVGCINPITIPEEGNENTDYLYLGANNTLYYPADEASVTIKAFRAYFKLNLPSGQQAKSFVLNFDDDNETTGIKQISNLSNTSNLSNSYFTLDGRRINDMPATPGLYIINGKKVVIK